MADMILVEPFALAAGTNVNQSRGNGLANLFTPDPREVWSDVATGTDVWFDIDLGADREWDTIALVNTNAAIENGLANWLVQCGTAAQGGPVAESVFTRSQMRLASDDANSPTGPAFYRSVPPRVSRFIRITMQQSGGFAPLTIGALVIGRSWSPVLPREVGAGRPPIDTGVRSRTEDGGLVVVDGVLVSGFRWTFGDLGPPDLAKLWGLFKRLRTTRPFLLVEDPAPATVEGVHWGTFVDLTAYERRDQDKSRWELRMEDWA